MDLLFELFGWIGAIGLLITFYMNSTGKLSVTNKWYQVVNLLSAILLTINALNLSAYPFVIVNVFWAGVAVLSLIRLQKA